MAKRGPVASRFFAKVSLPDADGCMIWTGARSGCGYGSFSDPTTGKIGGRAAHRWAWAYFNGPIPDDLTVDHLCFRKLCMNPAHMEIVPGPVNSSRAQVRHPRAWRDGKCQRGHEITGRDRKRQACFTCIEINARRRKAAREENAA